MADFSFSVEIFLSPIAKTLVGEPFNVSENFGYRKILCKRRGFHKSPMIIFCLTMRKWIREEPPKVLENFGYRKLLCTRGYITFLQWKVFCLTVLKKNCRGTVLCYRKIQHRRSSCLGKGGGHQGIVKKSYVSQDQNGKLSMGIVLL